MAKSGRFWRNVVVIAVAHVALIAGLIRWSLAARASNPESIVWLGAAKISRLKNRETRKSDQGNAMLMLLNRNRQKTTKLKRKNPL